MGDLLIRNVPESVKQAVEQAALREGRSLSATAIDLLRKSRLDQPQAVERPISAWEELRPLLYDGSAKGAEDFAAIMAEVEAGRKGDFGRLPSEPDR